MIDKTDISSNQRTVPRLREPSPDCSEALNATGVVYAVYDGRTHVSVFPIGGTLEDWYKAGSSSVWTTAVKSVVIKWKG